MDVQPVFSRPSLFRTLFFVAIGVASFVLMDSVLASTERRETALEAVRFNRQGQSLMQQGKYAEAAEAFRSAIANARDNTQYPLALGEALLNAGQLDAADATLADLLGSDSMAGAPNLVMARVFAKRGQFDEADFYYHRAIYGQWKDNADANRLAARFELVGFLAQRNRKAQLLAELLPLQEEAPQDADTQEKLASLYLTAASPARGAAIFQEQVRLHPDDLVAHEGMGDAEFALGNYVAARQGYVAALRLNPDNKASAKGLDLTDQVLNLDPMRRGLGEDERYQRSLHILQLVTNKITQCGTQSPGSAVLVDSAQLALKGHVHTTGQSEAVEANLDLANKLWHIENANCASAISAADEPLQLVLKKAAQ